MKCPKCPNTYNWTTRVVCRSCGCKLPQGNVSKAPPSQKGPAKESRINREIVSSHGHVKEDPLREDLESQLEQLRAALKDPRNPGARLDSAMAKMRKAKAKVQKCKEQLRQAEAALDSAHAEEEEASSELKAAQENAVPKQPELPPGVAAMQLSSEGHQRFDRYVKAARPSSHGGMRRRLRGACQKGTNRPPMVAHAKLPGRLQSWPTQLWWQGWQTASTFCRMR